MWRFFVIFIKGQLSIKLSLGRIDTERLKVLSLIELANNQEFKPRKMDNAIVVLVALLTLCPIVFVNLSMA